MLNRLRYPLDWPHFVFGLSFQFLVGMLVSFGLVRGYPLTHFLIDAVIGVPAWLLIARKNR